MRTRIDPSNRSTNAKTLVTSRVHPHRRFLYSTIRLRIMTFWTSRQIGRYKQRAVFTKSQTSNGLAHLIS